MAKNSLYLGSIRVRPYDNSSKLAEEKYSTEYFDDRNHFLLFRHQSHVAVAVTVFNDNFMGKRAPANNFTLEVAFIDKESDTTVTLKTIRGTMRTADAIQTYRVDLPVGFSDIDCQHRYAVSVRDAGEDKFLGEHGMTFYPLPSIKALPTHWYTVREGYINSEYPWSTEKARSLGSESPEHLYLCFELTLDERLKDYELPEVEVRIVSPRGKETIHLVVPEPDKDGDGKYTVTQGYLRDSDDPAGVYLAEIRCMGHAFSGFLFSTEGERIDGAWSGDYLGRNNDYTVEEGERRFRFLLEKLEKERAEELRKTQPEPVVPLRTAKSELDDLTGLDSVKKKLKQYTQLMTFNRMRRNSGLPELNLPLHCMFLGSPGTGKTTVARIIGQELKAIGALSKGHVVYRERGTLLGQYYHSEAEKTLEALEAAQGGVLFIDEAYQLCQPQDPKDPGRFVIETLMTALADESQRDWMLILAGYKEPMMKLFDINPGLRSRIPETNIYNFEDFTGEELLEIGKRYLTRNNFIFGKGAQETFCRRLSADYESRDESFGNARHVINLIQTEIIPSMAARLASIDAPTAEQLSTILPCDIRPATHIMTIERRPVGFAV